MSEQATATTENAAPAAETQPESPEQSQPAPLAREQARLEAREAVRARFAPPSTVEPPIPTQTPEPDPEPSPPPPRRVPIPEGHPLRAHGVDALTATDERQGAVLQKLLADSDTRDVDTLRREVSTMRQRAIELDVHTRTLAEWKQTPAYKQAVEQYTDIFDLYGQEAASRFWQGVQPDFQALLQPRLAAAIAEHQTGEAVSAWTRETWAAVSNLPETVRTLPGFRSWFDEAVRDFDAQLARGAHPGANTADALTAAFRKHFAARLLARPEVAAIYRRDAAEARYARERTASQPPAPQQPEPAVAQQRTEASRLTPSTTMTPNSRASLKQQLRRSVHSAARDWFGGRERGV